MLERLPGSGRACICRLRDHLHILPCREIIWGLLDGGGLTSMDAVAALRAQQVNRHYLNE